MATNRMLSSFHVLFLSLHLVSGMDYVFSVLGYTKPKPQIPKATLDPERMRDVDYCAEVLEFTLQQAIDYADEFYISSYQKMRASDKEIPKTEWRRQEAEVWCQADLEFDSYVDCFLGVLDYNGETRSSQIARYFVISSAERAVDCGFFKTHYDQLVTSLKTYPISKLSNDKGRCLKALFDVRPYSLQVISPYHRKKSHFDFLVKRSDGSTDNFTAIIVPTINVARAAQSIDMLESLVEGSPMVFNRIINDPSEMLPEQCRKPGLLPTVQPKPSSEPRDHLAGHLADTREALKELYGYKYNREWSYSISYHNRKAMTSSLCDEVLNVLAHAEVSVASTELLDCSHPLLQMTASPRCPQTRSVIGSSMFQRVINRHPGLWIAIRGQNCVESRTNSLKYLPLAWTTDDFYSFNIHDNPELSFHKFHIHKGSKGIFVIIVWADKVDLFERTIPQLPQIEADRPIDFFNSVIIPKEVEEFRQIFPNIYPMLEEDPISVPQHHYQRQDDVYAYRSDADRLRIWDTSDKRNRPSAPPQSPTQSLSHEPKPRQKIQLPQLHLDNRKPPKPGNEDLLKVDDFEELLFPDIPTNPLTFSPPQRAPQSRTEKKEEEKVKVASLL